MKAQIDKGEWYPVFYIETDPEEMLDYCPIIDLPGELVERYNRIMDEFWKLQEELEPLFMEHKDYTNGKL